MRADIGEGDAEGNYIHYIRVILIEWVSISNINNTLCELKLFFFVLVENKKRFLDVWKISVCYFNVFFISLFSSRRVDFSRAIFYTRTAEKGIGFQFTVENPRVTIGDFLFNEILIFLPFAHFLQRVNSIWWKFITWV